MLKYKRGLPDSRNQDTAIIIGGSIAGLCSAAAVAPYFKRVILFEKDPSPDRRFGVPQMPHFHGLLDGGREAMDQLLPGFSERLRANGSHLVQVSGEAHFFAGGKWLKQHQSDTFSYFQRRQVVDQTLIEVLQSTFPSVEIRWNSRIESIQGSHVRTSQGSFASSLIVVASGRRSPLIKPYIRKTSTTHIDLGYSTMEFEIPDQVSDTGSFYIMPTSACKRSGCCVRIEGGNRLIVTAGGYGDESPAGIKSVSEWMEFVQKLPQPHLFEFLKNATPVWSQPRGFGYKEMYLNDLMAVPPGLLFVGDAVCSVDPVFGQGMSKAAREALAIRNVLAKHGQVTQRHLNHIALPAFLLSCFDDYKFSHVKGYAPIGVGLAQKVLPWVFAAASRSDRVYDQFLRVMNMQDPPWSLLKLIAEIVHWNAAPQSQAYPDVVVPASPSSRHKAA